MAKGYFDKIDKGEDNVYIQPTVITVKKNKSIKLELDARAPYQVIDKDKYQMPKLENLVDMVAEKIDTEEGEVWFASVDLTIAYGQEPLDMLTARHCNFPILGRELKDTYRFTTEYYGLTVMPKDSQRIMDNLKANLSEVLVFIDDILIATNISTKEHLAKVREILHTLNQAKLLMKVILCKIAKDVALVQIGTIANK